MQKEFNKLSQEKQRKFIIKNLIKDDYFYNYHTKFKILFVEEIYKKNQQKDYIFLRNEYLLNKIIKFLTNYKDNIIDLSTNQNSRFFYEQALKNKNKIIKILNHKINYNYKDENDFTIKDFILDTWNSIKNIVTLQELSLENLFL